MFCNWPRYAFPRAPSFYIFHRAWLQDSPTSVTEVIILVCLTFTQGRNVSVSTLFALVTKSHFQNFLPQRSQTLRSFSVLLVSPSCLQLGHSGILTGNRQYCLNSSHDPSSNSAFSSRRRQSRKLRSFPLPRPPYPIIGY